MNCIKQKEYMALFILDRSWTTFVLSKSSLQCWSEIIETNAKNGVVFDATSNEQPI